MTRLLVAATAMLFGLVPHSAEAQSVERRIFDPCNTNALGWFVPQGATLDFSQGWLHFDNREESLKSTWLDSGTTGGFVLAVDTRHASDRTDLPYGLCFGGRDYGNEYFFLISADATFIVGKLENEQWVSATEWTRSEALNAGSSARNHLLVDCGDTWEFFINGALVHSMPAMETFGGGVGITVDDIHAVDFDDFLLAPFKSPPRDNEFTRRFGAIVDDFRNDFTSVRGDTIRSEDTEATLVKEWEVKAPLPGFEQQRFADYGQGIGYYGTFGSYPTYKASADAFLELRESILSTPTDCIVVDAGETEKDGRIESNNWYSVDVITGQKGPDARLAVTASIQDATATGGDWHVTLQVLPRSGP